MSSSKARKQTILYVDDEIINLENFKSVFINDFSVLTASSGKEALGIFTAAAPGDIAVVVTDQRMPEMSGTELLSKIFEIDPDPCRMILTAYSDFHVLSDGVNKGHIYSWVQKPWEYLTLKPILLRAVQTYLITRENKNLVKSLSEKNERLERELVLRERAEKKRREAEIRMLAQSKLASLGEMATGISHEINQPLTFIKILLEATLKDLEEERLDTYSLLHEDIPEGLKQIGRITTIIEHMRIFGREHPEPMRKVELGKIIGDTLIPMRQRLIDEGIALQVELNGLDSEIIQCAPTRIEQVLVNLIINSIDALEALNSEKTVRISARKQKGSVEITVFDNGCGMSEETRSKIFEPFFTTKEIGRGTGIGLSISFGIINEHKGNITCESGLLSGTIFTISLPESQPAPEKV